MIAVVVVEAEEEPPGAGPVGKVTFDANGIDALSLIVSAGAASVCSASDVDNVVDASTADDDGDPISPTAGAAWACACSNVDGVADVATAGADEDADPSSPTAVTEVVAVMAAAVMVAVAGSA